MNSYFTKFPVDEIGLYLYIYMYAPWAVFHNQNFVVFLKIWCKPSFLGKGFCEDKARWPMTRSIYFRSTYLLYLKGIVFRFKFQFMIPFLTFVLQFSHQIQSKWLTYCSSSAVWIFEKIWLTFALVQGTFRQHWIDSLTNIWQWFCMNHIDHAYRHKILLNSTRYNMCYISLHFTFY